MALLGAYTATTTLATAGTGVVVATPGFQGKVAEIKISGLAGAADATIRSSLGWMDGTRQNCDSLFSDGTLYDSRKVTNKVVSLWDNVDGTLTEVLSASFHSFTATQLKLNVTTASSAYQVSVKILA